MQVQSLGDGPTLCPYEKLNLQSAADKSLRLRMDQKYNELWEKQMRMAAWNYKGHKEIKKWKEAVESWEVKLRKWGGIYPWWKKNELCGSVTGNKKKIYVKYNSFWTINEYKKLAVFNRYAPTDNKNQ